MEEGTTNTPTAVDDASGTRAFQRAGLARTPPATRKQRHNSVGSSFLFPTPRLASQDEQARKRKREDRNSEETDKVSPAKAFSDKLKQLLEETRVLQKMTEECGNTKRVIKDAAKALVSRAFDVELEWETVEQDLILIKEQVSRAGRERGQPKNGERVKQAIEEGTFEALKTVLAEQWPEDVYAITEVGKDTDQGLENGDVAFVIDPEKTETSITLKKLEQRFPGLKEVASEAGDKIGYVIQTSQTRTSRNKAGQSSTAAYILPMKVGESADEKARGLHSLLKQLPQTAENNPTDRIKLVIDGGYDQKTLRKVAESACIGAKFKLVMRPLKAKNKNKQERKTNTNTRQHKEEGVVAITTGNLTYADLVKKIKSEVDVGNLGIKVNRIRKTEKGQVLVAVEGGEEKAIALKQEIAKKNSDLEITTRAQGQKKIFVLGMDPSTTETELVKALAEAVKVGEDWVKVLSLRAGRFEDKTAIVELPRNQAETLIAERRVKVGWLNCTVREHIEIQRCFNCLEHGHRARDCKVQTSRRDECLNCGQKGHRAKDCKNAPSCTKCGLEGHRADQIKCPHFRKEVERRRQDRWNAITKAGKTGRNGC